MSSAFAKRKVLDAQAAIIAKQDSQFVAKVAGHRRWHQGLPGEDAAKPASAGSVLAGQAGSSGRASSPMCSVTPDFHSPSALPTWLRAATAPLPAAGRSDTTGGVTAAGSSKQLQQEGSSKHTVATVTAVAAQQQPASAPAAPARASCSVSDSSHGGVWGMQQQQQQQQQQWQQEEQLYGNKQAVDGGTERPQSPSWVIKAASAGFRVKPGPLQVESSLYDNWASCQAASDQGVAAGSIRNSNRVFSAPAATSLALDIEEKLLQLHSNQNNSSRCTTTTTATSTNSAAAGPGGASLAAANVASAASQAGCQAAAAGSDGMLQHAASGPCSSNYISSRAAGAVAGISSRANCNDKYQSWLLAHYPGAKPPRREDVESLRQWLCQQLQKLHADQQQEQQQQDSQSAQPQQQRQLLRHTAEGAAASVQVPACTSPLLAGGSIPKQLHATNAAGSGTEAGTVCGSSVSWSQIALEAQTSQLMLPQLANEPNGVLDVQQLEQLEAVLSAAFDELCRQVSVGCVERGYFMMQLWSSRHSMMSAVLEDRRRAQAGEAAAHATAAAAQAEVQRLQQLQEDERVALRAISERHAVKAESARQQMEQYKQKHDQLQDLLQRLSAAQQLVQRVFDLETASTQQEATISSLTGQLQAAQEQAQQLSKELQVCQARADAAEKKVDELQGELGCNTPRPRRDLGLLCDLLTEREACLVEKALIAGVSPEQVHRLLLGVTSDGYDMRPWISIAGACSSAIKSAAEPVRLRQQLQQLLCACDAANLQRYLQPASAIHILNQAVHLGASPESLMQLLDGSLGLSGPPGSSNSMLQPVVGTDQLQGGQQQQQLGSHVGRAAAAGLPASSAIDQQCSSAEQHKAEQQRLLAAVDAGLPWISIVGVLATKFGRNTSELGGPVTEALANAALPTRSRLQDLEGKTKSLHREVVLLKRTLADQRKHEQERIDAALKDQKRKIARREARQPSLLDKFLQTKWGDYFIGIGQFEDIPAALRANVPINNKHMPKRDAEKLAREIWQFKDEQEATTGVRSHLADVTATFLERRFFAIPRLVTEVAYNFIYSLGQHAYDADCNLFLRVFTGDVEEAVRSEQQALEGEITRLLTLLDVSINRQATGWLHKADVKTAFAGFFKGKKVDRLSELYEALDTDEPGDVLNYSQLFCDDENFNQGMTAETIRSQHLQERLEFLQEVEDVIRDTAEDLQTTSLTPAMLHTCLSKAHKGLDPASLAAFVTRAFGPDWQLQQHQHKLAQPLGSITRAIRRGSLQPAMRPTAATAAGAVSKIAPVGKFQKKLLMALKVGMNESAGAGSTVASRRGSNVGFAPTDSAAQAAPVPAAAAAAGGVGSSMAQPGSRRRSTVESAVGSVAASSGTSAAAVRSRRATAEVVSAAVAAVLSNSTVGSKKARQPKQLETIKRGLADGAAMAADAAAAAAAAGGSAAEAVTEMKDAGQAVDASNEQQQQQGVASGGADASSSNSNGKGGDGSCNAMAAGLQPDKVATSTSAAFASASSKAADTPSAAAAAAAAGAMTAAACTCEPHSAPAVSRSFKARAPPPVVITPTAADTSSCLLLPTSPQPRPPAASPAAAAAGYGRECDAPAASASTTPNNRSSRQLLMAAQQQPATPSSSRRLMFSSSMSTVRGAAAKQQQQQGGSSSSYDGGSAALTVGMLSALEAVRQTWLKEEEVKMVAAAAAAASKAASGAGNSRGINPEAAATAGASAAGGCADVQSFFASSPRPGGLLQPNASCRFPWAESFNGHSNTSAAAAALAAASSSTSSLILSSNGYCLPVVPALQLGQLPSGGSSAAGSSRTDGSASASSSSSRTASSRSVSGTGAAATASVAAAGGELHGEDTAALGTAGALGDSTSPVLLNSQRGITLMTKPGILRHQGSGRAGGAKRVVISVETGGGGDSCPAASGGDAAAAAAAAAGLASAGGAACDGSDGVSVGDGVLCSSTPCTPRGLSRLHPQDVPAAAAAGIEGACGSSSGDGGSARGSGGTRNAKRSLSKRKSARIEPPPPLLLLTDADDVCDAGGGRLAAAAAASAAACGGTGLTANIPVQCGSGGGGDLVLSSDGMTVFSSNNAVAGCVTMMSSGGGSSATTAGFVMGPVDDVCMTPHAPEEGGKRNALLMRQLNKKKSLKRLEEVMLLVAAQGPEVDVAAGWEPQQ